MADTIRLLGLRAEPLSLDEVVRAVADPAAGGIATFTGAVRDHDGGKSVRQLDYSAHPTAADVMQQLAERVCDKHPVIGLAALHRTGLLQVGDLAVVVAVSCAHRAAAFDACRMLIDELKATVPIWKHQQFSDGSDEWVGTP